MIYVDDMIHLFQTMNAEHWSYVWGAAKKGCVDCSGAFVYAYKTLDNRSIYHGSNRMARVEIVEMLPISEAKPGMAAFKARKPGQGKYGLPGQYKQGGQYYNGDLNDYYHVGLVDEDARYVLNAQGTKAGFQRSAITQNWCGVGYLKQVQYGDEPEDKTMEEQPLYQATVTAESGKTVRMRDGCATTFHVIKDVPIGSTVDVLREGDQWHKIAYGGQTGYMMSKYLIKPGEEPKPGTGDSDIVTELRKIRSEIDRVIRMAGGE